MHRLRHLHACAQIERARLLALATEEELALLKRTQALAEEVPEHCSSREKDFPCKAMLLRLVLASLLTPQAARAHACGHVLDRGHRHVEHCDGPGCEGCMHEEGWRTDQKIGDACSRSLCKRQCRMHVQVAGLAKSVQQKKAELDAELAAVQSEQLVLPHQALPQHSSDDLHLSDPVEPELPAVPGERRASVSSAKDLWPGLDTSTPSGCAFAMLFVQHHGVAKTIQERAWRREEGLFASYWSCGPLCSSPGWASMLLQLTLVHAKRPLLQSQLQRLINSSPQASNR